MRGLQVALAAVVASMAGGPKIVLTRPLPAVVRVGQTVTIKGRLPHASAGASAALQNQRGGPWATVAKSRALTQGGFTIRWSVPASERMGPVTLRVAELNHGRVVATTRAKRSGVGSAPVYCAPPVPPAVDIPVGSGWIVGGLYEQGGPFPGIVQCWQRPYTIDAETSSGAVVASQQVAAGHSYTLVVPAGTYMLRASTCGSGSATVTATHETKANTICPVP